MQKGLLLAIALGTASYALVASQLWGSPTSISLPFELLRLMYIPCALAAVGCAIFSVLKIFAGHSRLFYVCCAAICLPMVSYFSYRPEYFYMKGYQGDQKLLSEYREAPDSLLLAVMTYYHLHPDRFHRTGVNDFVIVDGFGNFLRSLDPPITWSGVDPRQFQDNTSPIKVEGDVVKTPWGTPIHFLANTNGEFYVNTPDGKVGSDLVNDPWRRPNATCKIIVGAWTDTPAFSARYFPSKAPHDIVTLNDVDYDEIVQTSGKYLHDR